MPLSPAPGVVQSSVSQTTLDSAGGNAPAGNLGLLF